MKIKEAFARFEKGVSFEFFPPKSPAGREDFMKVVHRLESYDPLYVSVTCASGEQRFGKTLDALRWIRDETRLTPMSHLTGIGAAHEGIGAILRALKETGVDNILALRGDTPRNLPGFDPSKGDFAHASDLVRFIREVDDNFSIAVAVYPEGHPESGDLEKDIEYTRQKISAGADFAITQMFFDNRYFYDFLDRVRKAGIKIPVLPGIMPITDCRWVEEFAFSCNATVPEAIRNTMRPVLDKPEEMKKIGVEYALKQCEDLIRNGVNYLHFYTMNKADSVSQILDSLGMPGFCERLTGDPVSGL